MTDPWQSLIERIHATPQQGVLVVTGGGASAIAELLAVPGGSRTLLEAVVPYSEAALTDWLRRKPEQFCVEETALAMAAVAYERAGALDPAAGGSPHFGVACTASLVSDRPKKGEHRCYVATQTRTATASWSLVLDKGARDRRAEETLVGRLILNALASSVGLAQLPALDLRPGARAIVHHAAGDLLLVELLEGKRGVVWSLPGSGTSHPGLAAKSEVEVQSSLHTAIPVPRSPPAGLLCGAFHPLHFGHRQMREAAARRL